MKIIFFAVAFVVSFSAISADPKYDWDDFIPSDPTVRRLDYGPMAAIRKSKELAAEAKGKVTNSQSADEECNRIIMTKRNDVVGLNNCDIGIFKKEIESMAPTKKFAELLASNGESTPLSIYNEKMGFYKANIKTRQDINMAVSESVITKQEAMKMRSALMERESQYFSRMEDRMEKYKLSLENSVSTQHEQQTIVIQQPVTPIPDPFSKPQPTSMVCQKRDIFGEVKCDFK